MRNRSDNQPIVIQDIAVVSDRIYDPVKNKLESATGEFNKPMSPDRQESDDMLTRLSGHAITMLNYAGDTQRHENCISGTNILHAGKESSLTRVISNEFFYHTHRPLDLQEFEWVQQGLVNFARVQPQNTHAILGSFAVKTPDNRVMNVVPHLECGPEPKLNLIVKSNPSSIDPIYCEFNAATNSYGYLTPYQANVGKNAAEFNITIDNKPVAFSENNVLRCKTAGGKEFYSCVDICMDHRYGVAKKNLEQMVDQASQQTPDAGKRSSLPTHCAHTVVSNSVTIQPENKIGAVTHVDPECKPWQVREGGKAANIVTLDAQQYNFGTDGSAMKMEPYKCSSLPDKQMAKVTEYNNTNNPRLSTEERKESLRRFEEGGHYLAISQKTTDLKGVYRYNESRSEPAPVPVNFGNSNNESERTLSSGSRSP